MDSCFLDCCEGLYLADAYRWVVPMGTDPWAFGPTIMLVLMSVSVTVRADVIIGEIMYNPSGSDSNKEWVKYSTTAQPPSTWEGGYSKTSKT